MDQDQAIEIPRFRDQETGDNRIAKAVGQGFPASARLQDKRARYIGSWNVPVKKLATARAPIRIEELRSNGPDGWHAVSPDRPYHSAIAN